MKKLFLICLALGFITFSCQKEVIRPTHRDTFQSTDENKVTHPNNTKANSDSIPSNGGGGITDPNNDPDIYRRGRHTKN